MRRIFTIVWVSLASMLAVNAQVNVTFEVDMNNVAVDAAGVHVAGSFQSWDPAATELLDADNDSVYSVTLQMTANDAIEYKFVNGDAWGKDEAVPSLCAQNNNRALVVPASDTTINVCYSECLPCNIDIPTTPVTFEVNMSGVAVTGSVYVAGNWQGWSATDNELTHVGDSIYKGTFDIATNLPIEFKFVNGADWETVPVTCAVNDNRAFTVPATDTTYKVCFAECDTMACSPHAPDPDSVDVKFHVNMNGTEVSANGVHIAGSFQGWDEDSTQMMAIGDSIYEAIFKLEIGETYEFKYINGNTWDDAEQVPGACATNANRVFTVTPNDTMFAACFALCDMSCDSTVIDTNHTDTVCTSTLPLELSFHDSTVCDPQMEIILEAFGDFDAYKWSNNETGPSIDIVALGVYIVTATDSAGCTAMAEAEVSNADCAEPVNVTFSVNMSLVDSIAASGVHLAGNFQNWQPNTNQMDSMGNGIYSTTVQLIEGSEVEFKFINGNDWPGIEEVPGLCQIGGGNTNRTFVVPSQDYTFEVCFSECGPCVMDSCFSTLPLAIGDDINTCNPDTTITLDAGAEFDSYMWLGVQSSDQTATVDGHPMTYVVNAWDSAGCVARDTLAVTANGCVPEVQVTFIVDMANETVDANGVHVAGSFQGWDPAATTLSANGSAYEVTLTLEAGSTHQFKFLNGNDWPMVEGVPEACGVGNDLNREIMVPMNDTVFAVCFASCGPCVQDSCFSTLTLDAGDDFNTCNLDTAVVLDAGDDFETFAWEGAMTSDSNAIEIGGMPGVYMVSAWDSAGCVARDTIKVTDDGCAPEVNVTFEVDMSQVGTVSANGVHVAGSFQAWDPAATTLDSLGEGKYAVTLVLEVGETVEFKYLNGNAWDGSQEEVPANCAVNTNRTFVVPASDTTYTVCFEQCGPCVVDSCFSTLALDLGSDFNTCNVDTAVTLDAGADFSEFMWSTGAATQSIAIDGEPSQYIATAWDSAGCVVRDTLNVTNTGCIPSVNVTFEVDMSNETVDANGVHVAGSFQSWDPSATTLVDQGNGVYSVTLSIEVGTAVEFKYLNGNAWGSEEGVPAACAQNTNRYFTVPAADTTYSVCFAACVSCDDFVTVDVTFEVNMSSLDSISTDGVYLAGSLQGWNPSGTEMSQISNTSYSVTLTLEPGTEHEYKFLNGPDWTGAEIVPAACGTVNADSAQVNRMLTTPATDTTITLCFESCSDVCETSVAEIDQVIGLKVYPNPSRGQFKVAIDQPTAQLMVVDMIGNVVHMTSISSGVTEMDLTNLPEGLYVMQVATPAGTTYNKIQLHK